MAYKYLVLPPDKNVLAGRTVTSTSGTPDSDHPVSWLTDTRPAFPARWAAGAWGASVSVATQAVQLIALGNHSLDANVTLGGSVSGTLTAPALLENGVRKNPFLYLASPVAGATSVTFAGTNTAAAIIGEAFAGVPIEIPSFQMQDMTDEFFDGGGDDQLGGEWRNIPMHDDGLEWRIWGGTQIYTTTERDLILSWRRAQKGLQLPSVLVTDRTLNDARIVYIMRPSFKQAGHKDLWEGHLVFSEFPRYKW